MPLNCGARVRELQLPGVLLPCLAQQLLEGKKQLSDTLLSCCYVMQKKADLSIHGQNLVIREKL